VQLIDWIPGVKQLKAQVNALQNANITQLYNQVFPTWQSYKAVGIIRLVDEIYSVTHKLAVTCAGIPLYGYDKEGEYLNDADKLSVFLRTLTYTKKVELFHWLVLCDEAFCYKEKTLGLNGTVEKITFLNPQWMTLFVSTDFPQRIIGYKYCDPNTGYEKVLLEDEVIFMRGFNPTNDANQRWRGLSRVEILCRRLTRLESNMANSVAQMQNGGTPGVLFVKGLPSDGKAKGVSDGMKENYARFAKNPANKGAPFIQVGEFGYIQLGLSLADLDSAKLADMDMKAICNVWHLPVQWFNAETASTDSNVKAMMVQVYTAGVKPYTSMVEDAFNTELVIDFGADTRSVAFDFSDIPELAESLKDKIEAMNASVSVVPNEQRELLGYDRIDDPAMDEPWVKSGWEPLSSFTAVEPVTDGPL